MASAQTNYNSHRHIHTCVRTQTQTHNNNNNNSKIYEITDVNDITKELIINVNNNCIVKQINILTENSKLCKQIIWFFQIIYEMNDYEVSSLIKFVTGFKYLPFGGLKTLESNNIPFSIQHLYYGKYPIASTCFNEIEIPIYKNKSQMKKYLLSAINECEGLWIDDYY